MNSYQKAYEYLRSEVLVDPSIQGTFLNEQDLATEIGISRTPVREALRVLATEGLVDASQPWHLCFKGHAAAGA